MLQLYDKDHNKIEGLIKYEDYKIESVLSTGDKTLSFLYPKIASENIELEGYIRNKTDEFVIKEISNSDEDYICVLTKMNVEDLEGKEWDRFDTTEQTVKTSLNLACAGTGWTVKLIDNITKKRTVRKTACSTWDIIQEIKDIYRVELSFDSLNKVINVYEKIGEDKGVYFMDSLNLISLDYNNDSNDFYTRIRAEGKDGLTLDGKGYLENYQYSKKVKTLYWKDERYTILEDLKEDAAAKLEEVSKPKKSYKCDIEDLAKINKKEYSILDFNLGDIITLISKKDRFRDKQRIVKIIEYPDEPERNECELCNTMASFEDIQKQDKQVYDTVDNITSDDGTIAETAIKDVVEHIVINKADITDLNAAKARIGELEATSATINDLSAFKANINNLAATKADITDLNAANAKIGVLEGSTALINNLLAGNITADMTQTIHLTGNNVVIEEAVIKNLIASHISVEDLMAGSINTKNFNIISDDGNFIIKDNTLQIKDTNNIVRVQIGKEAGGDYSFSSWDKNGKLMFNSNGITEDAIKSSIIRNDMISENANIDGKKINISSLVKEINNGTETINSSKVLVDATGQTLDIAFNKMITDENLILRDSKGWYDPDEEINNGMFSFEVEDCAESPSKKCMSMKALWPSNQYFIEPKPELFKKSFEKGKTYSYRLYMKAASKKEKLEAYAKLFGESDFKDSNGKECGTFNITNEWKLYTFTVVCDKNGIPKMRIGFNAYGMEAGDSVKWHSLQIIEGSIFKSNGWIEYVSNLQTQLNINNGKIEGLIKDTKIDSNGATVNLKDDYMSLKATVSGINSTVSSVNSSLNALNSRVTSNTTNISQLNNKISLKVESSDIVKAIKDINFNAPNYIKNGCFLNGYDNWDETLEEDSSKSIVDSTSGYKKTFKIVTNGDDQNIVQETEVLPANTVYTASAYCYVEKGTASLIINVPDGSGKNTAYEVKSSGLGWQWLELTFTTKSTKSVCLYLGNYHNGASSYGTYYFTAVSIVKGKYRNDWQESSTYVNSSLANLSVEKNKIVSRVSSVETRSSSMNNTISNLSTRVSTAEQAITPSSIVAKVTSGITGGNPISTTAWKLEKDNFNIYNGAFNLYNKKNVKVFWVDTTGNTSLRGSIFNYDNNNILRASLTDKKLHIYNESGSYIGGLGSNSYVNNSSIKGLTLDLDMAGKYISFAVRKSSSSNTYDTVFSFHRAGSFDSVGLNAGCNLDMHNYTINNVKLAGVQAGGYKAFTGAIPIVKTITNKSGGGISWTYSNLQVRDGIIVGTWT